MNWLTTSLAWYTILFFLGIIFIPITKKIFGKFFFDFGYPFAKVLAILFLSYSVFVLGTAKILSFSQKNIFFIISIFFVFNLIVSRLNRSKDNKQPVSQSPSLSISLIVFEELLFLISFIFWVYVRGQEPSIRGLEKFMDFGFINSILRSKYFPPLDMWLAANSQHPAGFPINYYYFGHLVGAFLIKLSGIKPAIGYNLILATIFALGVTQVFSLVFNIGYIYLKKSPIFKMSFSLLLKLVFFGLVGAYIVNLGGNLHTIYAFTTGYPNEKPIPFWQILSGYNPTKYWYPNATRFIPFTIHEFPSYSWVVADLHGHVFDIPFVLLTLAVLLVFLVKTQRSKIKDQNYLIPIFLGFLTAVHYMTNAFDGPIYILLSLVFFSFIFGFSYQLLINVLILIGAFIVYALPFTLNFSPFISGIGVNCSADFLTKIGRLGPFIFEKGNCQATPLWMLFVLWGFFWVSFLIFLLLKYKERKTIIHQSAINNFILILFSFGTFLIIIPEFFYIKDIYPAHFRANTMFKLGYQAFIMMGISSALVLFQIKFLPFFKRFILNSIFMVFFFFIAIYPAFAIPSYYGKLNRPPKLDGSVWLMDYNPDDKEIIDYLNRYIVGQPVILEAQGDSYTDYERVSAYTGLPTVAGWWVHEWLWRGSSEVVGKRIPDVVSLYESTDLKLTKALIKKYQIRYIIISGLEKEKYPNLQKDKFNQIGKIIFQSITKNGLIYKVDKY